MIFGKLWLIFQCPDSRIPSEQSRSIEKHRRSDSVRGNLKEHQEIRLAEILSKSLKDKSGFAGNTTK